MDVRVRAPTFAPMLWMCFLTVHSAMKRDWDISRLLSPAINAVKDLDLPAGQREPVLESPSPGRSELVTWLQGDEAGGRAVVERHLPRVHPRGRSDRPGSPRAPR